MKRTPPHPKSSLFHALIALVIVVAAIALWRAGRVSRTQPAPAPAVAAAMPAPPAKNDPAPAVAPATIQAASKTFDTFQLKPFAVAKETVTHGWTAEDGRTQDAILEIAHNELEVERLMEENARIERRQLVYRKEPVWVNVERAKATGEPLKKLTLPAFDGQEVEMEVTRTDLAPSGLSGSFAGRLTGREQSVVTLAFDKGREAFTVLSPEDGTFLQGHPREPGEIILTSFDPNTYQPLPGGEPIKTNQTLPIAQ